MRQYHAGFLSEWNQVGLLSSGRDEFAVVVAKSVLSCVSI
jgi:hypothetical protein